MNVLATGYPSLDHIVRVSQTPAVGETAIMLSSPDASVTYGGCGANTAVALAKLGVSSGVALVLGDDQAGSEYVHYLNAADVNTDNVIRLENEPSSLSYLFVNPDNQHQNYFLPGAADAWRGELKLTGLSGVKLALVTVGPLHYNRQFVEQITAANVPLLWGLKPDIAAYPPEMIAVFLAASTYVVMNDIELAYVMKVMNCKQPAGLLRNRIKAVVVTHGAAGAQVITPAGEISVPAVTTAQVADPTGAGDGFNAGFIAGLMWGDPPEIAARWGAVLASFVIETLGCQTNLPTQEQLKQRYANQNWDGLWKKHST